VITSLPMPLVEGGKALLILNLSPIKRVSGQLQSLAALSLEKSHQ